MNAMETSKILLHAAKRHGATGARVGVKEAYAYGVRVEQGNESPEISHERKIGLVVYVGDRNAMVGGSATSKKGLTALARKAVEMARVSTPDPYSFLAPEELWAAGISERTPALEVFDTAPPPTLKELAGMAHAIEEGALSCNGVSRTEITEADFVCTHTLLATSNGFIGEHARTHYDLGGVAIAGAGEQMVSGTESDERTHREDLKDPSAIGRIAGERASRRLGSASMAGGVMPVVFDALVSPQILGTFLSAISGDAVYLGQTFLKNMLHERICPPDVTIIDYPNLPRMIGSHLYDGDGVGIYFLKIVKEGVLKSWLTSLKSAAQLSVRCTGHEGGIGNVILENTPISRQDLIADISRGFLVTNLLGYGADLVTGTYSVGAEGFLIENGAIGRPIDEMTIAGNMLDVFRTMRVANDRYVQWQISAPSIRVDNVMVAGKN